MVKELPFAAASEGANIALHYLSSREEAVFTAKEISCTYNVNVHLVKGNIAKMEDVIRMKEELDQSLGSLECIVNNVGFTKMKSFFQYELDEWKHEVDVFFYGCSEFSAYVCP